MFNRFDLGFYVLLTHSSEEVYKSASAPTDQSIADSILGLYNDNTGYSPGLAEVIGCFAEPEMPKAIKHGTDTFISIFSARSSYGMFFKRLCSRPTSHQRGSKKLEPPFQNIHRMGNGLYIIAQGMMKTNSW